MFSIYSRPGILGKRPPPPDRQQHHNPTNPSLSSGLAAILPPTCPSSSTSNSTTTSPNWSALFLPTPLTHSPIWTAFDNRTPHPPFPQERGWSLRTCSSHQETSSSSRHHSGGRSQAKSLGNSYYLVSYSGTSLWHSWLPLWTNNLPNYLVQVSSSWL